MTSGDLRALFVATLTDPARAARQLIAAELPRQAVWLALLLAAALNAILFTLSNMAVPTPEMFPGFMRSPLVYFALVVLGFVVFVMALSWAGRLLGGLGEFDRVLVVMVWFQYLRLAVQAASLVLVLTIPALSVVLVLAATVVGIWILLHFIAQAHGLDSLGRAAGVLIVAALAMVVATSMFIALVGGPMLGSVHHV